MKSAAVLTDKRLVFTVTPGRSGTGWLAELVKCHGGVSAFHEPPPSFRTVFRQAQADGGVALRFLQEEKLAAIARAPQRVYVETSHMFCKGFLEPLLSLGIVPDLIVLSRAPRAVARSLYELETIPGRTEKALRFYLKPSDPGIFIGLDDWEHLHDYQLCFWYALEIMERQACYAKLVRDLGGTVVPIATEDLRQPRNVLALFTALGLPRPGLRARLRLELACRRRVNTKADRKRPFPFSDAELDRLERETSERCRPQRGRGP